MIQVMEGPQTSIEPKHEFDDFKVNSTPVILSYFAERGKGTRGEITLTTFNIAKKLRESNIHLDVIFRGNFNNPSTNDIQSDTIDDELNFWLSNYFLKECTIHESSDDICFETAKKATINKYKLRNISNMINDFNWPSTEKKEKFIRVLQEVIPFAKSD